MQTLAIRAIILAHSVMEGAFEVVAMARITGPPIRRAVLAATLALALFSVEPASASVPGRDTDCREWFLAEAPSRWEEVIRNKLDYAGTCASVNMDSRTRRVAIRWSGEIKQIGENCVVIQEMQQFETGERRYEVIGINPNYAFELQKKAKDESWAITNLDVNLEDGVQFDSARTVAANTSTAFLLRVAGGEVGTLPAMVKDPAFVLKNAERVREGNKDFVRVSFGHQGPRDPNRVWRDGWVILDPEHYWVIRRFEFRTEWFKGKGQYETGRIRGEIDFAVTTKGAPLPVKHQMQITIDKPNAPAEERLLVRDYALRENADIPDVEFTLTAFGLPEPTGIKRPVPWFIWIGGIGLLCVVIGLVFAWLKRRAANRVT